jgi:hypothetical protein
MSGDPADVGGAPVDVLVAQIEDQARGVLRAHGVAGRRMDHALRLAGGARGVEDEQRVLGVERLRFMPVGLLVDHVVPLDVPS